MPLAAGCWKEQSPSHFTCKLSIDNWLTTIRRQNSWLEGLLVWANKNNLSCSNSKVLEFVKSYRSQSLHHSKCMLHLDIVKDSCKVCKDIMPSTPNTECQKAEAAETDSEVRQKPHQAELQQIHRLPDHKPSKCKTRLDYKGISNQRWRRRHEGHSEPREKKDCANVLLQYAIYEEESFTSRDHPPTHTRDREKDWKITSLKSET